LKKRVALLEAQVDQLKKNEKGHLMTREQNCREIVTLRNENSELKNMLRADLKRKLPDTDL
jgi:hypothetical protein